MFNVLVSYAYLRTNPTAWLQLLGAIHRDVPLLIDSGAFTAYTVGKPIALDEYTRFVKLVEPLTYGCIQLDVVRNAAATLDNLRRMVDAGTRPMPVLTSDMDEAEFSRLVDVNPKVCIAGGVSEDPTFYSARIERCWRAAAGMCAIHGLGYTRGVAPLRDRVASIDSSTWGVGSRYGMLAVFRRHEGCVQTAFRAKVYARRWSDVAPDVRDLLTRAGVAFTADLDDEIGGEMGLLTALNVNNFLDYATLCERRGTKFFFAVGSLRQLGTLALGMHSRRGGTVDWATWQRDRDRALRIARDPLKLAAYVVDGVARMKEAV
jgi:hypothetical protein